MAGTEQPSAEVTVAIDVLVRVFTTLLWGWAPTVFLRHRHELARRIYVEGLPFAVFGMWGDVVYMALTHQSLGSRVLTAAMAAVWTVVWRRDDDDTWRRRRRRLRQRVVQRGRKLVVVPSAG